MQPYGRVAEWLGRGLQNLVQRFESAHDLFSFLQSPIYTVQPSYTSRQETANRFSHLAGILIFIPAGFYLIWKGIEATKSGAIQYPNLLLSSLLFSSCTALMTYVSSFLYHSSTLHLKIRFRKWDHISIFWSIAGFYLPFIVLNYEISGNRLWLLYIMIGLALAGTFFKLFFLNINKFVYTAIYLLMGWMVVFFGKEFFTNLPSPTIWLLIGGGVAYTIGVFFYLQKRLYYSHAIWHGFVLLGGVLHYFSILSFINSFIGS